MRLADRVWTDAGHLIVKGMDGAIGAKSRIFDFSRTIEVATRLKRSEFGDTII